MAASPATWKARTDEDELLRAYWKQLGAQDTIYTEVGLGGKSKSSPWKVGSGQCRLDGVRLLPSRRPGILPKQGSTRLLSNLEDGTRAELIEVKKGLSEQLLGQCLVGRVLFEHQHPNVPVERTVALCGVADPLLEWVCSQPDIDVAVEVVAKSKKRPGPMVSRSSYLFDESWTAALEPWRTKNPGLFYTRIPLGMTYANLLRIPKGPDLLAQFDTKDRFRKAVGNQAVDIIEVRRKLYRGVAGRLLAHAKLLTHEYGIEEARKQVFVAQTDAAVEWACNELGIEVHVLSISAAQVPDIDDGPEDS